METPAAPGPGAGQLFPLALLEVKVTEPPAQKVVGPPGVIVGVGKDEFTVTTVGKEVREVQPATTAKTVTLCEVVTVVVVVKSPVLQLFPLDALEVSTTLPPVQKVVGPPLIVGVGGIGLTVTTTAFETAEVHPATITWQV